MSQAASRVKNFMDTVLQYPLPDQQAMLDNGRLNWFFLALREELEELKHAESLEQQTDAFLDMLYFLYGRLLEMGHTPAEIGAMFSEVHRANMEKVPGDRKDKERGNMQHGYDAIKPEGWEPPNLKQFLTREAPMLNGLFPAKVCDLIRPSDREEVEKDGMITKHPRVTAHEARRVEGKIRVMPKLIIVGHGRHGKDTVCDYLVQKYGYEFTSSSMFCAEEVCMPYFNGRSHLPDYESVEDCYEDRHGETVVPIGTEGKVRTYLHRTEWFDAITAYNTPDKSRLGRAILAKYDIYNGLRNKSELWACQAAGVADYVIWVDALDRLPPENPNSMNIEPWMADYHIDNNGSLDELERNIYRLMEKIIEEYNR